MPEAVAKSMQIPDVPGFELVKALELLKAQGVDKISVHITAPPRLRGEKYDDHSRIVRQRVLDDGMLELLVCNMDSPKQGC